MPCNVSNTPSMLITFSDSSTWVQECRDALANLSNLTFTTDYSWNFDLSLTENISDYSPPDLPPSVDPATVDFTISDVKSIDYDKPGDIDLSDFPNFDRDLEVDLSGVPGEAPQYSIGDPPSVPDPTFPSAPSWSDPTLPTIDGLDIGNIDPVATIDTTINIPTFNTADPVNSLAYDETMWTSTDLADMQTHMDRIRSGDFSITASIWQQIFDRAAMQLRREAIARERAGRRAWSKNGWEMPGGMAAASAEQAAQDVLNSTSLKALETAVNEALQKDDQFWKSIEHGVRIETLYADVWHKFYERELRFYIALQEASITIYNALVAKFNIQMESVRAQVEAKRLELENERLKLEQQRLTIEAAIARGEVDKIEVELYKAQWEGIRAQIDAYNGQLVAVKTEVEARRLQIEAHGLKVEQWKSQVEAWGIEWEGYKARMMGQETSAKIFDSHVKAFGEQVRLFDTKIRGREAEIQADVDYAKLQIQDIANDVERFAAQYRAKTGILDTNARIAQANADVYGSKVRGEQARVQTEVDRARVELGELEAHQRGQMEEGKLKVEQLIASAQLYQRTAEALGNIYAQLTSAIYNTYHYNSQVSSSVSNSCSDYSSNNNNYNYSM